MLLVLGLPVLLLVLRLPILLLVLGLFGLRLVLPVLLLFGLWLIWLSGLRLVLPILRLRLFRVRLLRSIILVWIVAHKFSLRTKIFDFS